MLGSDMPCVRPTAPNASSEVSNLLITENPSTKPNLTCLIRIVTDARAVMLAHPLRAENYSICASVGASGTTSPLIRDISNAHMP